MDEPLSMQDALCVLLCAHRYSNDYAAAFIDEARKQVEGRGMALIDLAEAKARRESTEIVLEDAVRREAEAKAKAAQ